MGRIKVLFQLVAVAAVALLATGCGFTQTAPVADSGAVTVALSDGSAKPGGTSGALESATITSITLEISASDMTTINTTIPTGTLETSVDVPAGDSRTFTAIVTIAGQAFNGTTTEDVTAGSSLTVEIPITIDGTTYAIYTAGGTVSGLSGSVTLQLTSSAGSISNTKAVSSNGSFAFTADYFRTTWDYAVTVSADPTSPNQTCAVSSGSGSVNAGNVTNVSVACTTDKYKVGGSVSGLSGTVVLQNNSGDDLTLTADGSFSFATPIDDASTYSVTVLTNPSGQTCSVSSGSGTMNGAAVTSVSVTCATNTYTVGGTISGLTGTVVLQNNGGDDVTETTNSFGTFPTPLADGSNYNVTVLTQPSGQICTVSNGTGTISGANITNVTVTCVISGGSASVLPLYSSTGADWNDYVVSDGTGQYDASDTVCDAASDGPGYSACIHGGEKRSVTVTGFSVCGDLAATDSLSAFDWICDASTGTAKMISTGLKDGKNLSDLLDFSTPGWLSNTVTVTGTGAGLPFTTASSAWWSNTVAKANSGGSLATAGTVYVVTSDPTAAYTIGASKVALVIQPSVTLTGPGSSGMVIYAYTQNFLWLEGTIDATGDKAGIQWGTVKFSVIRNASALNGTTEGFYILGSSNNSLSNVTATTNNRGVYLSVSSNNTLSYVTASNNGTDGVQLIGSTNNTLSNITASNNTGNGVNLSSSSNNSLSNITATNNGSNGVNLGSSSNNSLSNITASNNGNYGVYLSSSSSSSLSNITVSNNVLDGVNLWGSSNISLSNITASNNGRSGVVFSYSSNNSLSNITANNNISKGVNLSYSTYNSLLNITAANNNDGVEIWQTSNISMSNITAANNNRYGVVLSSSNDYVTGLLKVGNNATNDCYYGSGTAFSDVNCTAVSPSDFALTQSVTLATSFVAKVTTDDTANTSDSNGTATYAASLDWTTFENSYRAWGIDGSAFPAADHRGQWTTGTGRIWDWSLALYDMGDPTGGGIPVNESVLTLPTGSDTITHQWTGTAADQSACTSLFPGSLWVATDDCRTTFLRNAVEIAGDAIGNDNGLCETDETCLFTPNIGSYQGHGTLQSAGAFTDGTITGVTLMEYPTNGY